MKTDLVNPEIIGSFCGEIEMKRFYLPGIEIKGRCPSGHEIILDLSDHYLAYPQPEKPDTIECICYQCSDECHSVYLKVDVILSVTIALVKK